MKYFTEQELRIENANIIIKKNMTTLVEKILDPLREKIGVIRVTSGYRTPEYNKQIGGSPTSQHCKGEAVDIQPSNKSIQEVFEIIKKEFDFDQVILEKNNSGAEWIHVSYKTVGNRKKAMKAIVINGKATYKNA